jgi:hypothetical protein
MKVGQLIFQCRKGKRLTSTSGQQRWSHLQIEKQYRNLRKIPLPN